MSYTIKILGLLLVVALFEVGCKKEEACDDPMNQACPNYDPCYGEVPLTAAISMKEVIYEFRGSPYRDSFEAGILAVEADTVLQGNRVSFEAAGTAERYEWQVGTDPRVFEGEHFSLRFFTGEQNFTATTLSVRLTAYKERLEHCYASDTVFSTVRNLTVVPKEATLITGKFEGISTQYPDSTIVVDIYEHPVYLSNTVINIPVGCQMHIIDQYSETRPALRGYRVAAMEPSTSYNPYYPRCYPTQGILRVSEDHQHLTIHYHSNDNFSGIEPLPRHDFIFVGKRVN